MNDALLNTLGEEQAAAWARFYAIEVRRMSGHPAVQQALRNDYFESLGLPRIYARQGAQSQQPFAD
jgi:hypothetical protein